MITFHYPPCRSGQAIIAKITDAQAFALLPGDILIHRTLRGHAPFLVREWRMGIAYDDSDGARPFEVPVVIGSILGGPRMQDATPPMVYGIGELLDIEIEL